MKTWKFPAAPQGSQTQGQYRGPWSTERTMCKGIMELPGGQRCSRNCYFASSNCTVCFDLTGSSTAREITRFSVRTKDESVVCKFHPASVNRAAQSGSWKPASLSLSPSLWRASVAETASSSRVLQLRTRFAVAFVRAFWPFLAIADVAVAIFSAEF